MNRNVLFAVFQIIVSALLTFCLFAWTTRVSGLETVGLWGLILGLGSVSRFSELGLGASAVRHVAIAKADHGASWTATIIGTTILTVCVLAFVAASLLLVGICLMDSSLQQSTAYQSLNGFIGYSVLALALASIATVVSSCLDGLERFDLRVLSVISGQMGMTICGLLLVEEFGVKGLVVGLFAQALITIMLGVFFISFAMRKKITELLKFDFSACKSLLGYGVKIAGSSALILLFEPFTKFMLAQTSGLSIVGAFEIGNQVVQKFRSILSGALQVLTPRFAALSGNDRDRGNLNAVVDSAYKLLLPVLFFGLGSLFLSSYTVAALVAPEYRLQVALVMQVLCLSWLVNSASLPIYFFNIGAGNAWVNLQCFGLMTLANISLAYLFLDIFEGMGVLLAYGTSLTIGGVFLIIVYMRTYGIAIRSLTRSLSYFKVLFVFFAYSLFYWFRPIASADITTLALYSAVTVGLSFALLFISKPVRTVSYPAISKILGFSS